MGRVESAEREERKGRESFPLKRVSENTGKLFQSGDRLHCNGFWDKVCRNKAMRGAEASS